MAFSILAFRPASVVEHLEPRNEACPLSLRDLLPAVASAPLALPVVQAPAPLVARAALVAAKEARSALGLALPPGVAPGRWFAAMVEAADAIGPGLPIFFCGRVTARGSDERSREQAYQEAYRLVDAGITHVAVDLTGLPASDQADVFAQVQAAAVEREIGIEYVLRPDELVPDVSVLFEALQHRGTLPDLLGVPSWLQSPGPEEARAELQRLAQVCAAFGRTPVMFRGPVARHLSARLPGSPVKMCEDGGAAAVAAARALPPELTRHLQGTVERQDDLEHEAVDFAAWEAELSPESLERAEARAYVEIAGLIDDLAAADSALRVREALERQVETN